jgi:hypothetical protein
LKKKSQIGTEYLIIVGFVTFAIISVLAIAYIYSNQIKDKIKLNQVESFADQVVSSSESVFFSGEPSRTTVELYLPEGVNSIGLNSDSLIVNTSVSSGNNVRVFDSKVPLNGTISVSEGKKKLSLEATQSYVQIIQLN